MTDNFFCAITRPLSDRLAKIANLAKIAKVAKMAKVAKVAKTAYQATFNFKFLYY